MPTPRPEGPPATFRPQAVAYHSLAQDTVNRFEHKGHSARVLLFVTCALGVLLGIVLSLPVQTCVSIQTASLDRGARVSMPLPEPHPAARPGQSLSWTAGSANRGRLLVRDVVTGREPDSAVVKAEITESHLSRRTVRETRSTEIRVCLPRETILQAMLSHITHV